MKPVAKKVTAPAETTETVVAKATKAVAAATGEKKEKKIGIRKFKDDQVITLLVDYNPKRANTAAHASFENYEDEMTVKEFLAAGGLAISLGWDSAHGYIEIGDTFNDDAEKKSKPAPKPKAEKAPKAAKAEGAAPAAAKKVVKKAAPVVEEEEEEEAE